jgi:gamma-glutamylaminecyclotransferase
VLGVSSGRALQKRRFRLFAYGTLLAGERDHALLGDAERMGPAVTRPLYSLYEVGPYAALVAGGSTAVRGELYDLDRDTLLSIDVARQVPRLFDRARISLEDGTEAEAYLMPPENVRGKRRVRCGSWLERFRVERRASDWSKWALGGGGKR